MLFLHRHRLRHKKRRVGVPVSNVPLYTRVLSSAVSGYTLWCNKRISTEDLLLKRVCYSAITLMREALRIRQRDTKDASFGLYCMCSLQRLHHFLIPRSAAAKVSSAGILNCLVAGILWWRPPAIILQCETL